MSFKLRTKFLVPILTVICLGMGVATYLSYSQSKKAVRSAMLQQAEQISSGLTNQVNVWIEDIIKDSSIIKHETIFKRLVTDPENKMLVAEAMGVLRDATSTYDYLEGIGLFGKDGVAIAYSVPGSNGKTDISKRAYFAEVMQDKVAVSDALQSITTGNNIVVIAQPFEFAGEIEGAFLAVVSLDKFAERFVDPIKLGEKGYAYIMARSGLLAAHPDKSLIMKTNLKDFAWGRELGHAEDGVMEYSFRGQDKLVAHNKEPLTGWVIGVGADTNDIFSAVAEIRDTSVLVGCLVVLISGLVVFFIVRAIVAALNKGVAFAEAVADGDLDQDFEVKRTDEIGKLGNSLKAMVANLKEMIAMADQKTIEAEEQTSKAQVAMQEADEARREAENAKREGMLQAAGQLEGIVNRVTSSAQELSSIIEQSSRGADVQRERAAETATAMEQMNATVLEVAANAGNAASSADNARERAVDGAGVVDNVVTSVTEVRDQTEQMKVSLGELGEQAQGIGNIMGVISDIADQTNLLALNAAIEAARAGDAGRGFAVVADEVRKLAEKTMTATDEVEHAVSSIQKSTQENINAMDKAVGTVETSTSLAGEAGDSLREIVEIVDGTADQVRAIATASEEQSAASEQISSSAEEVNVIAGETSQAMVESSRSVNELNELSGELNQLIEQLKNA